MRLEDFDSRIDPATLDQCEVVGVRDDLVIYFQQIDGTVYNDGTTLNEFVESSAGWQMTETEAARVGLGDYATYLKIRHQALDQENNHSLALMTP